MKILREQWQGLGMAFDYALGLSSPNAPKLQINDPLDKVPEPTGDTEMAAAVWRNLLGARGARGIDDPGRVRRAFNVSGEYAMPKLNKENPEESLKKLEETDDNSGIYDFVGEETQRYLQYPQLMFTLVRYVRTELARLEDISDTHIIEGGGVGTFGRLGKEKTNA
jgi:cytochrome b pre-mRNA-processing protein 3